MTAIRFTAMPWRKTVYRLLFLAISCAPAGCISPNRFAGTGDYQHVRFYTISAKIPVINIRLNGKEAWFIIDTGASVTLLNASLAKHFGFTVNTGSLRKEAQINGLGGQLPIHETYACSLRIGDLTIKHFAWKSRDMSELFSIIRNDEKLTIAGILGSDILARYRININYDTRTLSYRVKKNALQQDSLAASTVVRKNPVPEKMP